MSSVVHESGETPFMPILPFNALNINVNSKVYPVCTLN